MTEAELDLLAHMVEEDDRRDGDPDLEDADQEDGEDDYLQPRDPFGRRVEATWIDDEDFEESGPADRWNEDGPFGHEDDEESGLGRDCVPL